MRCSASVGWWAVAAGLAMMVVGAQAFTKYISTYEKPISVTKSVSCHTLSHQEKESHTEVLCRGLKSLKEVTLHLSEEQLPLITTLTIAHANISSFTLDDLVDLPSLHTVMFNHSQISNWTAPQHDLLPNVTTLLLNHCWNNSELRAKEKKPTLELTSQMLSFVPSLKELHIVDCFLMKLERLDNVTHLHKLNIVDGGVGCEDDKLWLLDWLEAGRASISKNTTCFVPTLNYMATMYSFNGRELLMCLGYKKKTQRECVPPCNCSVTGIKDSLMPIIHVYCRRIGLTELPQIPHYTRRLYLEGNNITNMSLLFTNERYYHIDSISLNHNRITYMDGELYYNYIKNRSLDIGILLAHNKLSTMPVKEMRQLYNEAVKEGKIHLPTFDLGHNPWNCDDCNFLPDFQDLVYYQSIKMNFFNIRCANWSTNAGQQVIRLDVKALCAPEPPLLQPLDMLNICMGILLLLLMLNFLHNFIQYRRHGKLPWIIIKLPCC
nr:protein singed wings 2-like [Procambarus clarkii]